MPPLGIWTRERLRDCIGICESFGEDTTEKFRVPQLPIKVGQGVIPRIEELTYDAGILLKS